MANKTNKSTCTPERMEKAREYVAGAYLDLDEVIPTTSGLALYLGVARMTPYNWSGQLESNEFAEEIGELLDEIQARQEVILVNGALSKKFDSSFARMVACNHGYSEKSKHDHTSSDGSMKPTQIIITAADDKGDS